MPIHRRFQCKKLPSLSPDDTVQILPYAFPDNEAAGLFIQEVFDDFPNAIITVEVDGQQVKVGFDENSVLQIDPESLPA